MKSEFRDGALKRLKSLCAESAEDRAASVAALVEAVRIISSTAVVLNTLPVLLVVERLCTH